MLWSSNIKCHDMKEKLPFHKIENSCIFSFLAQEAQKHDWGRKKIHKWMTKEQAKSIPCTLLKALSYRLGQESVSSGAVKTRFFGLSAKSSKYSQLDSQLGAISLKTSSRNFRWEVALWEATTCVDSRAQQQRRQPMAKSCKTKTSCCLNF